MITQNGDLRCDGCGKKLGEHLEGKIEIVCPRCKRYNLFDANAIKKYDTVKDSAYST